MNDFQIKVTLIITEIKKNGIGIFCRLLIFPLVNIIAFSLQISKIRCLVSFPTLFRLFSTLDTVAGDTFASFAISFTVIRFLTLFSAPKVNNYLCLTPLQ